MIKYKKLVQVLIILVASAVCFLGLAWFLYENDNKYTQDSLQPIGGILALSEEDVLDDLFFLTNGWQYFDHALLTPKDFEQGLPEASMQFITIGKYNNFSFGSPHKSPYGVATYGLLLDLPEQPQIYRLDLPEIYSAYELYINEDLILSMGDLETEEIEIGKQSISFSASGKTELLIAVKNNSYCYSGMTFPPVFGLNEEVLEWEYTTLLLHIFFIVVIFIIFLFALYFGLKLKNKSALFLSFISFFLFIQSIYPVFFRFFTIKNSYLLGIELFSIYIINFFIIQLQHKLLRGNTIGYKFFSPLIFGFCCLLLVYGGIPFYNPMIHQGFSSLIRSMKYIIVIYLVVNTIYGGYMKEPASPLVAVFTGSIAVGLFADRYFSFYEPIYGSFFTEYSGWITVVLGASYIWRDLTEAYCFKLTFVEEKRILTRQVSIQKTQYLEIIENIEETRKQKHDLRHHFKTIYFYLMQEKIDKAIEYLGNQEINLEINDTLVLCENTIADALLRYYKKLCDTHNIKIEIGLFMPNEIFIEDTDISIILGNLLENAYDASLKIPNSFIKVIGNYGEGCFVMQIENRYYSKIRRKGKQIYSTKHDGFGIGTASVRAVSEKYDGFTIFEEKNDVFIASITLQGI